MPYRDGQADSMYLYQQLKHRPYYNARAEDDFDDDDDAYFFLQSGKPLDERDRAFLHLLQRFLRYMYRQGKMSHGMHASLTQAIWRPERIGQRPCDR